MRAIAHVCFLSLVVFGVGTDNSFASEPAFSTTQAEPQHLRVVVTFANEPRQAPAPAGTTGRRYTGDGYTLAQSAHRQAKRVASKYSLREVASWPIKTLAVHCVVYEIPDARSVATVVAILAKDSQVALAEPLAQFHTLTSASKTGTPAYNDPLYDLQTNLTALDIATAHARSQGAGVRIALIDTGVDTKHPDLRGRIAHTESFVDSRASSAAAYRHGTAMAGLIAAVANNHVGIVGIAPLATINVYEACWQLKPDNDAAVCNTFTLAKALAAALDSGAPLVNLSIAGPADALLTALVGAAIKRGVTFVGAAAEPADGFPTGIPGVIAVQGLDRSFMTGALSIPAAHILTLRPEGQYDFVSGTSVAAAEMTGIIALLMSANDGHLTTSKIASLLRETMGSPASSATVPASIDVNAALAQLDIERHPERTASRAIH